MKLNIIIPMHNESAGLAAFRDELVKASVDIETRFKCQVSFVFVDDGSTDDTVEMLQSLDFGAHGCELVILSRNFGKEAAMSAGIEVAKASDAAVIIDADLEMSPELIADLVDKWQSEQVDSVFYYKDDRKGREGKFKTALTNLFYRIVNFDARFKLVKNAGDFRLINRDVMEALCNLPENQRFLKGLYGWVGFKQLGLPYFHGGRHGARAHGKTNYNPWKLAILALDGITSFSTAPLRMIMIGGIFISFFSVLYGIYIVAEALFFPHIGQGIPSALTLIAFFGGVQLFALGLIGEYVGRVLAEAKNRPAYIVGRRVSVNTRKD